MPYEIILYIALSFAIFQIIRYSMAIRIIMGVRLRKARVFYKDKEELPLYLDGLFEDTAAA